MYFIVVTAKMCGSERDLSLSFFVIDTIHSGTLRLGIEDLFKYVILTDMKDNHCVISYF